MIMCCISASQLTDKRNAVNLHKKLKCLSSSIYLKQNERYINAKSQIGILSVVAKADDMIEIFVTGHTEKKDAEIVRELLGGTYEGTV